MSTGRKNRASVVAGSIMFAPYLVLLVAFGIIPILVAVSTSLEPEILNPGGGPLNYLVALQDFRFLPALANVGIFLLIYVPSMLIVVAAMSLLLDTVRGRWNLPLRLTYIVPASLTGATAVLVWYFLLEPTLSPYQSILQAMGITQGGQIWRADNLAWIFALMAFFTGAGNWIVVQYGSLQSVPDEILEAARIDGANAWQLAWHVKLPLASRSSWNRSSSHRPSIRGLRRTGHSTSSATASRFNRTTSPAQRHCHSCCSSSA